jgi:uncharacterized protein Veg
MAGVDKVSVPDRTVMAELKRREEIQAQMEQKRECFCQLQVGDRVEFTVAVGRRGTLKLTRQGEVIATSPRHITLAWTDERGRKRKETIIVNDYMTGESELRRIGEVFAPPAPATEEVEEVGAKTKYEMPSKEELERLYAELGGIEALAEHYGCSKSVIIRWFDKLGVQTKGPGGNMRSKKLEKTKPDIKPNEEAGNTMKFTWYGRESRRVATKNDCCFYISKKCFRVSAAAAELLGIEAGSQVEIGLNEKEDALGLKKAIGTNGLTARGSKTKPGYASKSLVLSTSAIIERMQAAGWVLPCRIEVSKELIKGEEVLVGWKPKSEKRVS